jgi:hypothetical protein
LRAWAVGDGQGGSLADRVGLVALDNGGWERAVGGVRADSLSGSNPDWRKTGSRIGWWNDAWGACRGESLDWLGEGARAIGDGESFAGSGRVGLCALGEGG